MFKLLIPLLGLLLCTACELSKDLKVQNIEGYDFSLFDIQEHCTVKRDGDRHLAILCAKDNLRRLMNSCEGQMTQGLVDPKFYCSGGLWVLNNSCYIKMLDTQKGNIKCKKK
jgi:hypothetical protein